jgi:hypothetical protein
MKPDPKLGREMKAFMDAELHKAALLPPAELRVLLDQWMAPLQQAFDFVRQLQLTWVDWIEQHREQIEAFNKFMHQAASVAGEFVATAEKASKNFAITLVRLEGLAAMGWTFPTQLSVAELHEFAQLQSTEAAADFLIRKFDESDPEFRMMEQRLLKETLLNEFSTILPQCFRSIRREDFAIAIPSLMAMLERVIQRLNPPNLAASTKVAKTLKRDGPIAIKARHDLFCNAVFFSLATVVTALWKRYPLLMPGAPALSRPAIQHGRVEPPNSKQEVVRLLNTLETALALHDHLNQSRLPGSGVENLDSRQQAFQAMFTATFYLPRGKEHLDRKP